MKDAAEAASREDPTRTNNQSFNKQQPTNKVKSPKRAPAAQPLQRGRQGGTLEGRELGEERAA